MSWRDEHGSTRSVALIRIGLAAIAWWQLGDRLYLGVARSTVDLVVIAVLYAASVAMFLGVQARLSTAVTGLCLIVSYHHFGPEIGELRRHQSWLLASATSLLALTPCGCSLSWDRLRKGHAEWGPLWARRLIALQLSAVYLFGALHKMNEAFLSGARLEHIAAGHYFGSDLPDAPAVFAGLAVAVTGFEVILAFGLWWERSRRVLWLPGIAMHAAFALLLPVGSFSALAALLYLAFAPPERVHVVIDSLLASGLRSRISS